MPNEGLPSEVAARCITLVRDRQRVLPYPIHRDTKVLYVVILNDRPRHAKLVEQMIAEIKAYTDHITVLDDPGSRVLFEEVDSGKYDLALCSVGNLQSYGTNVLRLHGPVARNMMDGWMKLGTPVIFLSHFDPFIHREYQSAADTVINTYGFTDDTAKALLERIVGQTPICRELRAHQ